MVPVIGSKVIAGYGTVATWRVAASGPSMIIMTCSDSINGVFVPATSVDVVGRSGLLALREAIDEALTAEMFKELQK